MTIQYKIRGLDCALNKAQYRARTRTLSSQQVSDTLTKLQEKLDDFLFKKDQAGLIINVTVFTKVASSYNGIPESTFVELERGKTTWKLRRVYRGNGIAAEIEILNLSNFKDKIMSKLDSRFSRFYFAD